MNWKDILTKSAKWSMANLKLVIFCGLTALVTWNVRGCLVPVIGAEQHGMGWLDEPEYVANEVKSLKLPYFGDAGKDLILKEEDRDAFLWKAYEQSFGHPWVAHNQNGTGCCVGEGFASAVELLQGAEKINGENQDCKEICSASMYALSREVGKMLGGRDGSRGINAAKALTTLGCVSCEEAGTENSSGKAHAAVAKRWGSSGIPEKLRPLLRKVKTASLVRTPEEVRSAVVNWYPVAICSNVGFGTYRNEDIPEPRNADGLVRPYGTWPHCMCVAGYRADKKWFLILQSWGENTPSGPTTLGQPNCSFWVDWKTMQKIVGQGESYALSSFDGYKPRDLNVFVQAPASRSVAARAMLESIPSPITTGRGKVPCLLELFFLSRF